MTNCYWRVLKWCVTECVPNISFLYIYTDLASFHVKKMYKKINPKKPLPQTIRKPTCGRETELQKNII